jgi:hypothetical protein
VGAANTQKPAAQKPAATSRARPPSLRPVDVDVDAVAGGLQLEVANRVAAMVAYLCEREHLSEKERAALVAAALRHMDGLESSFARALRRELGG